MRVRIPHHSLPSWLPAPGGAGSVSAFVPCTGHPAPAVHWLREEAERGVLWIGPDSPGYTVASSAQRHSLVLLDVGRQHQGTYTCIATNTAGQALCSASLHVSGCEWGWHWPGEVVRHVVGPVLVTGEVVRYGCAQGAGAGVSSGHQAAWTLWF